LAKGSKDSGQSRRLLALAEIYDGAKRTDAARIGDVETKDLQFMHLRHTAVTRLGEDEVDETLIAAVTGHTLTSIHQILERYLIRTSKMARLAFQKRLDREEE